MLRRLHHEQPESFAFTQANQAWAEAQITKYPEGRQASAIIPLLWRAQEQEGWLTRPAIEFVADFLGMPYIRALEVATFYFMFQLEPVGSVAHIQVCGTTTCMICGAENLMEVCKQKIAPKPHMLSADGKFSWEEVECLGACSNAPMAQIGKDYYEDLTAERFAEILDELAAGQVPVPGPQNGRYAAEPKSGLVALTDFESGRTQYNASVARAVEIGDGIKRIDGTEVPLRAPWQGKADVADIAEKEPAILAAPREGGADDLKLLKGVGPKLEGMLNDLGIYHYDQIAAWTEAEIAWVDTRLAFKGRVERDGWIEQAKQLAAGEETEFSKRAKDDKIYD
ncbi:NADH-quinone oxidoreductase subunit NuoE [Pseudodonghicola sp.]|uniref:NADH-quinone oxidoreductase subunit NuoE n=1 Tax=Pseudodonghicola sp. TaxID=1969463 RepID=UPI003A96FACD